MRHTRNRGDAEQLTFATNGSLSLRASGDTVTEDELDIIRSRMPDPSVLDEHDLFVWTVLASTDELDSYYTRMHPDDTLPNYAADAEKGVAFLDSHNMRKLAFGWSFGGRFIAGTRNKPARVEADFFTVTGMNVNGVSTDDFRTGIRAGILHDVSIGFMPGRFECNFCGGDPFDWWFGTCSHVPGVEYNSDGSRVDRDDDRALLDALARSIQEYERAKKKSGREICFAWVRDAHLGEVSTVGDGSNPSAAVLKARHLATTGQADERDVAHMERCLRVELPRAQKIYAVRDGVVYALDVSGRGPAKTPQDAERIVREAISEIQGVDDMEDERTARAVENDEAQDATSHPVEDDVVDETVVETNDDDGEDDAAERSSTEIVETPASGGSEERMSGTGANVDVSERVRAILTRHGITVETDPIATVESLASERASLVERATLGDRWRERVIQEALTEGRRVYDKDFDEETRKRQIEALASAGLDLVEQQRDEWRAQADSRFAGGRRTIDASDANAASLRLVEDGDIDLSALADDDDETVAI